MSQKSAVIGAFRSCYCSLVPVSNCSLSGALLYRSPAVAYFDRGHPYFRNFNSTIPVDVVRVKSYVNSFLDPTTGHYPLLAEWQTDLCPVQGTRQAPRIGRDWESFWPHFSRDSNYAIRDLVSDIRGGFFFIIWRIHRYQLKQGAIKTKLLLKLLLRSLILDSFPVISNQFSHFSAPLRNPLRGKGQFIFLFL